MRLTLVHGCFPERMATMGQSGRVQHYANGLDLEPVKARAQPPFLIDDVGDHAVHLLAAAGGDELKTVGLREFDARALASGAPVAENPGRRVPSMHGAVPTKALTWRPRPKPRT